MTLVPPVVEVGQLDLPQPYLLFLGDVTEAGYAKTAFGLPVAGPIRGGDEFERLIDNCLETA